MYVKQLLSLAITTGDHTPPPLIKNGSSYPEWKKDDNGYCGSYGGAVRIIKKELAIQLQGGQGAGSL